MPSVRPRISWLPAADLSQMPSCMRTVFSTRRRASTMISPMTSSTTLRVLEYGALKTATVRRAAAARSTWLVPMQKQPTASRSVPASSTRSVMVVLERIPSRSMPGRACTSSSSDIAALRRSTSNPAASRRATAEGWMFSSSSAFTPPSLGGIPARTDSATPRGRPYLADPSRVDAVRRRPVAVVACGRRPVACLTRCGRRPVAVEFERRVGTAPGRQQATGRHPGASTSDGSAF